MTARSTLAVLAVAALVALTGPASATQEDVAVGRQLFEANCAMCHGADAAGMMGMHPSLRGAIDRLTREGVEVTIRNGRDTNPPMPAFEARLTDQQIDQVIAYIDTLPRGPRNFGPDTEGGMMDGMMGGWMWIFPVLLVFAIGLGAWALIRALQRDKRTDATAAREVLDRRYAAGEISREEYLERRSDLES